MKQIDVKVRYIFEGTYTVMAEDLEHAELMVTDSCGLVMGGNIHTTLDDEEVLDWNFGTHPDVEIVSFRERRKRQKPIVTMEFADRIEALRKDIIDAIRQLLYSHGLNKIEFPAEEKDPIWVIWFGDFGDPFECSVKGIEVSDYGFTVLAEEKESGQIVKCHSPHQLGARNIDWLHEIYQAAYELLENQGINA